MEVNAVYGGKGKKGKSNKGKKGKNKGKGKHRDKQENNSKFEGYCGHCGELEQKQEDCRCKNIVTKKDEEEFMDPTSGSASSSTTRVTSAPPGLSSAGIVQPTTGMISTLMEGHVQSGWLCELETGVDDSNSREDETVELFGGHRGNRACLWASRFHTRCVGEGATSSAQNCDW